MPLETRSRWVCSMCGLRLALLHHPRQQSKCQCHPIISDADVDDHSYQLTKQSSRVSFRVQHMLQDGAHAHEIHNEIQGFPAQYDAVCHTRVGQADLSLALSEENLARGRSMAKLLRVVSVSELR